MTSERKYTLGEAAALLAEKSNASLLTLAHERNRKYTLEDAGDLFAGHSNASVFTRLQSELTVAASLGAHRAAMLDYFGKVIAVIRSGMP